jgi:4'-phosphopantetheinyl transferase
MILINYINIDLIDDYKNLIPNVPEFIQKQVNSYVKENDQKRCLFGKLVLRKLLMEGGYSKRVLDEIKIDENNRPYINQDIDFNISHSGNYVICAISMQSRIGIDIEEIKNIDINEIKEIVFNDEDDKRFQNTQTPLELFYDTWTLKEAALKADGKGLMMPLKDIEIYNEKLLCCNQLWSFEKLNINESYSAYVVYNGNHTVSMNEINICSII